MLWMSTLLLKQCIGTSGRNSTGRSESSNFLNWKFYRKEEFDMYSHLSELGVRIYLIADRLGVRWGARKGSITRASRGMFYANKDIRHKCTY